MKLYELTDEYKSLMQMLDDDTDIPAEALADTLESIASEIEVKADNIACMLKNLDADIAAIKAEEARLAERRKSKQASYDRIKQYLSDELQKADLSKIETARNKISFRKSESVEIADEGDFIRWAEVNRDDLLTYAEPKVNKTAIKAAIKEGANIVGAQIVEKQNIQIKWGTYEHSNHYNSNYLLNTHRIIDSFQNRG